MRRLADFNQRNYAYGGKLFVLHERTFATPEIFACLRFLGLERTKPVHCGGRIEKMQVYTALRYDPFAVHSVCGKIAGSNE